MRPSHPSIAAWPRRKVLEAHLRTLPLSLFGLFTLTFALFGARVTVFQTLVLVALVWLLVLAHRTHRATLNLHQAQSASLELISSDLAELLTQEAPMPSLDLHTRLEEAR